MSDPYVRDVAQVPTIDGYTVTIRVDYDSVSIGGHYRLTRSQAEEFAKAFVAACWEASDNAVHMRMDEALSDG